MCKHAVKVRAVDVMAAIAPDGCLAGAERQKFFHIRPTTYAILEFCGNPGCEQVFRAERATQRAGTP
jgi:hypothetical protein